MRLLALIVKINVMRLSYREIQCNIFSLDFPSNFTLDLMMAFIVKCNVFFKGKYDVFFSGLKNRSLILVLSKLI